jgi:hypothetical protein
MEQLAHLPHLQGLGGAQQGRFKDPLGVQGIHHPTSEKTNFSF